MEKIAILGASRGLGRSLAVTVQESVPSRLFLVARNLKKLEEVCRPEDLPCSLDLSDLRNVEPLLGSLREFSPHRIFYVAGGGPFGAYGSKAWKDHEWAFNLNYLFPSRLIHSLLRNRQDFPQLKQFIGVGSKIAGDQPDPMAASYSAAKHGLHGLLRNLRLEQTALDIRVYAPGYMDTDLLPKSAWPRQQAGLVANVLDEARRLWQWSLSPLD